MVRISRLLTNINDTLRMTPASDVFFEARRNGDHAMKPVAAIVMMRTSGLPSRVVTISILTMLLIACMDAVMRFQAEPRRVHPQIFEQVSGVHIASLPSSSSKVLCSSTSGQATFAMILCGCFLCCAAFAATSCSRSDVARSIFLARDQAC